jgi:UDP-N-acetylmuramate--alanine ligase
VHVTEQHTLPASLAGYRVHLVGIKWTGMAALAEVLTSRGARVSGSDTDEVFYTDAVLRKLAIPFAEGFDARNLPIDAQLVVHSAAYRREENPELAAAAARGIPMLLYPEALGALSLSADSSGICGVHGKSTTTALCGLILKAWGFPATVLAGTEVPDFGGRSTLVQGTRYFVAETCEYRRHFLNFRPARIVMTSVEPDHLDYFRDLDDILDAFVEYGLRLGDGGSLVYCADDEGASAAAGRIASRRPDVHVIPYGRTAAGAWRVVSESEGSGELSFSLAGSAVRFTLRVPGAYTVLNAAAAIALCSLLWVVERGSAPPDFAAAAAALGAFRGSRRRSEVVGEASGVLFQDDYAHHPTAILKTLEGIRRFYPGRRIVVDFMSHTYSRTRSLLREFSVSFAPAEVVILHRIYASAREKNDSGVTGRDLFDQTTRHHPNVHYFDDPLDALPYLQSELRPGDILVTMGAGDNWKVGRETLRRRGGNR